MATTKRIHAQRAATPTAQAHVGTTRSKAISTVAFPPQSQKKYWAKDIADRFKDETSPLALAMNRQRLLTVLLASDALYLPEPDFGHFNGYFSWRTSHDPLIEQLLKYYYLRFNAIDRTFPNDAVKRRLEYSWDIAKHIVCSTDPTTNFIEILAEHWHLDKKFLDYVLRDPNPDFIRCNYKHGWLGPMYDPYVFVDRGRAMLRKQMVTVYGFHPDNLNGAANPGGRTLKNLRDEDNNASR